MQVLSGEEIDKWFQGFQDFEPESDYVHADKDRSWLRSCGRHVSGYP